jgi:large repetitive protein
MADVNGDGRLDMVVANAPLSGDGTVGVLLNNTGPHTPTTTTLVSSVNPANRFQIVTYTASVTTQSGGTPTGTVAFQDGGSTVATVTLVGDQATYSTSYNKIGVHLMTATYSGDLHNDSSTSPILTEDIRGGSKTVVTTSGSPSYVGQAVTFTATVTSGLGKIPDGELVTFLDGTTAMGTGATASGVATFTTSSLTAKTHTIKAAYPGDATFKPSSGTVQQVVNKYPTTTALSSSPNPSKFGQAVTFTATVTPSGPYAPTGKVKFFDGTTGIGSATLSGGVAKLTKSTLTVGTHPITAQYLGDSFNDKSTSPVLNQVVQ